MNAPQMALTSPSRPPLYGEIKEVGGLLVCHVCGRLYRLVALHAVKAHGFVDSAEYREEFGLAITASLACPATAQLHREQNLRGQTPGRRVTGPPKRRHSGPLGPRRAQADRAIRAGRRRCEEMRREQLVPRYLAVRAIVANQIDRSSRHFRSALQKALADAGMPMTQQTLRKWERSLGLFIPARQWFTDDELLVPLAALGAKMGRSPSAAEQRRMGLPPRITYRKRFGSFKEACRRAGLAAPVPGHQVTA